MKLEVNTGSFYVELRTASDCFMELDVIDRFGLMDDPVIVSLDRNEVTQLRDHLNKILNDASPSPQ